MVTHGTRQTGRAPSSGKAASGASSSKKRPSSEPKTAREKRAAAKTSSRSAERKGLINPLRGGLASRLLKVPAQIMGPRLLLIISVLILSVFGLVMVYSASSITAFNDFNDPAYYVVRQAKFLAMGIIACIAFAAIPYKVWSNPITFVTMWVLSVLLLVATSSGLGGLSALGAERSISVAGFALQPAEFAKITVLLTLCALVWMQRSGELSVKRFFTLAAVATLIPLVLIYRQPDLGTAIILAIGIIAVSWLAGVPWYFVVGLFGALLLYIAIACIAQPYHVQRILAMFDPWTDPQGSGYQSIQSLYAFGSGGIFGTGLGLSRQKYLYLPYAYTDFIFAIIGEELGLVGTVSTVLLFAILLYAGIKISRGAPDLLGCMIAGSFTVMIVFQACVNMACVIGIAPVTGKAMPFISYGGSSLLATMIMIGVILSVSLRSHVVTQHDRRRDDLLVVEGKQPVRPHSSPPHSPQHEDVGDTRRRRPVLISGGKRSSENRAATGRRPSDSRSSAAKTAGRSAGDGPSGQKRIPGNHTNASVQDAAHTGRLRYSDANRRPSTKPSNGSGRTR